jgi:hypothetical protein
VGIGEHKSSKMAHFVFKCNKEDYLSLQKTEILVGHIHIVANTDPNANMGTKQTVGELYRTFQDYKSAISHREILRIGDFTIG